MKTKLGLVALTLALAAPAMADEYDFVGYKYSQDYQRDYDRGFFFGAEAWLTDVRNLNFSPALVTDGVNTGGDFFELDIDEEVTGRFFVGYRANRRVGTFTLRYWNYDEGVEDGGLGFDFYPNDAHPVHGAFFNEFVAFADLAMEYGEAEWKNDFGQGRKFTGFWTAALHAWELTYQTDAFFTQPSSGSSLLVSDFTNTEGWGGKVGLGGRFQFNDRVSMSASGKVGYTSTEMDSFFLDNPGFESSGDDGFDHFLVRDDSELTTLQYEGEINFNLRAAAGFEIDFGYRYMVFENAIANDRFTTGSPAGPAPALASSRDLRDIAFEGPYVAAKWVVGVTKIDSDGDGVLDVYDDCPDTPAGAWVDEKGCPRDLDEDGVYDGIDRCPGTPFGSRVDEYGCSVDEDGDTVPDGLDLCPGTQRCARVDSRGCPVDTDGDGIPDGCDACPRSPAGAVVDEDGCSTDGDADGDTVPDSRDRCPNTARGAKVDEFGCEQVIEMVLHFDTNSAVISPSDYDLLNRIAEALVADGGTFEVGGHADHRASTEYNQGLSERRAGSVSDYLTGRGVPAGNLVAVGYSELRPVASNDTAEGMALNRRVEIVRR